ncbi:MAG: NAD(P)/FAD-dependent oxidoreductase [Chloroflexota bacterium]
MPTDPAYDATIIGSGPNGLAAAITLARAGLSVLVVEAKETVGGGSRSAQLTLPGFTHDICSAIHPLGIGSPFFRNLPLHEHGLEWIEPPTPLAHPFDDGTAVVCERSITATATERNLGVDAHAYRRIMQPLVRDWPLVEDFFLGPLRIPQPFQPIALARFGIPALLPVRTLAQIAFKEERARALLAGMAAHSMLPLEKVATSAIALVLSILAHSVGWPMAKGGSQAIADAMASYLRSLGGEIITGMKVDTLDQLPRSRAVLFDVTPRQMVKIAGKRLPASYTRRLSRFRYGPGVFKLDYALDGPVPWRAEECSRAATVHVGGTLAEIALSERDQSHGRHSERPYVIVAQQSLFDSTRAPVGKHTLWAYCHVPNGSTFDMTERIEAQIERFAPGFRDLILARHTMSPADFQAYNPNYIGGDINGGAQDILQIYTRPLPQLVPYKTANPRLFICSASTPPGGGVHGMGGYFAARAALRELW